MSWVREAVAGFGRGEARPQSPPPPLADTLHHHQWLTTTTTRSTKAQTPPHATTNGERSAGCSYGGNAATPASEAQDQLGVAQSSESVHAA